MNQLRTTLGVGLLIAAALVVPACGSEENNDYVDEVNELQGAYVEDVTDLTSVAPSSPDAVAKTAADLADLTARLASDIEDVEPPDDVAELHQQLVGELDKVADQIGGLEEDLAGSNPQQAVQAATDLTSAITRSQTEIQSLIGQINEELG
ncbi:MAG TPA: DUF6376 family protein [Solirubrobacterales bacterium]|nr:DUF6376 family protein [Solirubrobacterales bacterium]